jgi:hypothetical protein
MPILQTGCSSRSFGTKLGDSIFIHYATYSIMTVGLIALDAKTGKQLWSVLTIDPDKKMSITGAPKAFAGKVLIGNGGSEAAMPDMALRTMPNYTHYI